VGETRELWSELASERAQCPVTKLADINATRVTSYAAVKQLLRDTASFSNRFGTVDPGDEELPRDDQILAFADPPRHGRQRKLLVAALSASRVERLRSSMQATVDRLMHTIVTGEQAEFELVADLASPFPAHVTAELMGVPHELRDKFVHFSHLAELASGMPGVYDAELREWSDIIEELVRERRAAGPDASDDLITTMCFAEVDGEHLSEREVAQMVVLVNEAGNTTTTTLITNIAYALDEFPEQRALFLADIDGLVESVIEEGLRYDGPIQGLGRKALCPADLAGYHIPKGEKVFGSYAAANHDPDVYDRPDEFVVGRDWRQTPSHMGFGHGIHHCLGANVARMEAKVALTSLYKRLPGLRVKPGFEPVAVPGQIFRGWTELQMCFDRPGAEA
jgi:cytochrome P450